MRGIGVLLFALLGWGCPGERSTCHFWSEEFPCPAGPGRPFAPAPPRLADWTCPAGWLAVPAWEPDEDEEAAGDPAPPRVCEPPPLPEGCPRGTMPVLGERECRPVGVPCPRGDWPRGLPAGQTVLHVRPGAVGGDGSSRDAPLGSLAEAVEAAPDGAVVALAQGIYREAVVLRRPVTLWGACATGTVLLAPSAEEETGTIEVTGRGGVVLRNLGVMGHRPGIRVLEHEQPVRIEGVVVERAQVRGISLEGAGLTVLEDVVVRETLPREPAGTSGQGLWVRHGAAVRVTRALSESNRGAAYAVKDAGTDVVLSDVVARETRSQASDGEFGRGLEVGGGAAVRVVRGLFERSRDVGVSVFDEDTLVELTDVVVRETRGRASDGEGGAGLTVWGGPHVRVVRGLLDLNRATGVYGESAGSEVDLTDVAVRGAPAQESDGQFGRGLEVWEGARARVVRGLFLRNHNAGVLAVGAGSEAELDDVVVRGTESQEGDGLFGRGLDVEAGASLRVRRALLDGTRETGIVGLGEGTHLDLADLTIRDTRGRASDQAGGWGLRARDGATLRLGRALLERNRGAGVIVHGEGTDAELTDLTVRDTRSQESDGQYGEGMDVRGGASARLVRGLFEGNRGIGVLVMGKGTEADLTDLEVSDTAGWESDGSGGIGLEAWDGATVRLSRGLLRRNRSAGVVALGDGTEAELTDLVVVDTDAQQSDGQFGRGLDVWGGALVRLTRGVVRGSRDIGVRISDTGTEAELDGLAVWNVRSQQPEATGFDGQGLLATGGAHVRVRDGVFRFNRGWAVGAWGPGTHLELRHALIDYTAWAEEYGWGVGLAVVGARLDVEEFRLRSNYWAGMLIARSEGDADGGAGADPVVSAKNGVITENRIGLHLMVEGLDLDSAFTNVDNYDNETDYSFEEIPVPDPAGALGEVLR